MNRARVITTAAVTAAFAALPAAASAASSPADATTPPPATSTTPTTTTPAPTTPTPPPAKPKPGPKPKAARLSLALAGGDYHVGKATLGVTGHAIMVSGRIAPYVPHQKVALHVFLGHTRVKDVTVAPTPTKTKQTATFSLSFTSVHTGPIQVSAIHAATAQQKRATASSTPVTIVAPSTSGPFVGLLQQKLAAVGYATPQNGTFDAATQRAVLAYRKVQGWSRTSQVTPNLVDRLLAGQGAFKVRFPQQGRHIEANLGWQVLAEIDNGKVIRAYTTSSGKPSTPTVLGTYHVYMKTPGTNSEGMVDSSYFIRGYAIHGYYDVPTYNASHGCLRIPIPDALAVYNWVQVGTPVDVYY